MRWRSRNSDEPPGPVADPARHCLHESGAAAASVVALAAAAGLEAGMPRICSNTWFAIDESAGMHAVMAAGEQCALIRDLFGNPFRPVACDPAWLSWNGVTIPTLAKTVYEERELPSGHLDPLRLALLADMVEDAGCSDPSILEHLRGPGPHVRGCWAVDLVLGKT